jgi:hypothetical protein
MNATLKVVDDFNRTKDADIVGTNTTACGGSLVHLIDEAIAPCCNMLNDSCTPAPFQPNQRAAANDAFASVFAGGPLTTVRKSSVLCGSRLF